MKLLFEKVWLAFFARPSLARLNYYIMNLFQKSLGINNYQSDKISGEIYWANYLLKNYSVELIFDIGAHKGDYSRIFRSLGYHGEILLFEPHPETYERLITRDGVFENDRHFNIGFSNTNGLQLMFDYNKEGGSPHASLYSGVITDLHRGETKSVGVMLHTVDEFAKEQKIENISLLKIDTEGNEFKILQGAKQLIEDDKIDIIQFEFGEMNVVSRCFFKDFYDLLNPKYKLYRLLPNSLLPIVEYNARQHEIFIFQNVVAIHRALTTK